MNRTSAARVTGAVLLATGVVTALSVPAFGAPAAPVAPTGSDTESYPAELLQCQHLAGLRQVLADLDLMSCLGRLGHAEHIGSSVSGPMVWRDLDVGVLPAAKR